MDAFITIPIIFVISEHLRDVTESLVWIKTLNGRAERSGNTGHSYNSLSDTLWPTTRTCLFSIRMILFCNVTSLKRQVTRDRELRDITWQRFLFRHARAVAWRVEFSRRRPRVRNCHFKFQSLSDLWPRNKAKTFTKITDHWSTVISTRVSPQSLRLRNPEIITDRTWRRRPPQPLGYKRAIKVNHQRVTVQDHLLLNFLRVNLCPVESLSPGEG